MSTPNGPITATRRPGTRARAVTAALFAAGALATGALATGCGTTQAGAPSGGSAPTASAASASAAPSASSASAAPTGSDGSSGSAGPAGSAAPSGPAAPVPTASGGRVTPGVPACVGWPASAPTVNLPVSFVPVAVERCMNGVQTVPGKGLWQTASLQRADSDLDALVSALHQPPGTRKPGTACPMLAIIPPRVLLISATGQELIPRLPVSGCGLIQSQVLAALAALPWRVVSVRLIAPVPDVTSTATSTTGTVP